MQDAKESLVFYCFLEIFQVRINRGELLHPIDRVGDFQC